MKTGRVILFLAAVFYAGSLFPQHCKQIEHGSKRFSFIEQHPRIETGWYPEWLEYTGGKKMLPDSLPHQEKLVHNYFKAGFSGAMHEDTRSTDVSNFKGPLPINATAQYFHVLEKGRHFSGMCPAFEFINDTTAVTMSFGRYATTMLLLNMTDSISVYDAIDIPGRGSSVWELIGKKGRDKIFHNTAGGAYSYLSKDDYMYIPGADNTILKIKIGTNRFVREDITVFDVKEQMAEGDYVDEALKGKDKLNVLTALMPDIDGNIWFTSRHGIVGLLRTNETDEKGCPRIYATYIGLLAGIEKIKAHFVKSLNMNRILIRSVTLNLFLPNPLQPLKRYSCPIPGPGRKSRILSPWDSTGSSLYLTMPCINSGSTTKKNASN